jgi:hypothetical protein
MRFFFTGHQSLELQMRSKDCADHQRQDEEDQADYAAPPEADASRGENEAPK